MFKKALIAEDYESANISVRKTLEDFGIENRAYVYYCDDALLRLQHAINEGEPYELLITDLYFEDDSYSPQKLTGGIDLVKAARLLQPDIKILVFSAERKTSIIKILIEELQIDGYVCKARRDIEELKKAMEAISNHTKYLSTGLRQAIKDKDSYEFSAYDITLITLLSEGIPQKEIPNYLFANQIKPSGLSSIEKRLSLMREELGFSKNEQLIALCKDMGII